MNASKYRIAGSILALILIVLPTIVSAAVFERALTIGSSGPDVSTLQEILKGKGFFNHPVITGYFGQLTFTAVASFQQSVGLEPVGSVGPATRAILNGLQASNPANNVTTEQKSALLSLIIKKIQQILVDKGYKVELTGVFDTSTLAAIQSIKSDTTDGSGKAQLNARGSGSGGGGGGDDEEEEPVLTFSEAFNDGDLAVLEEWFQDNTGNRASTTDIYEGTYVVADQDDADALEGLLVRGKISITGDDVELHDFTVEADGPLASITRLIDVDGDASGVYIHHFTADGMNENRSQGVGGDSFAEDITVEYGDISRMGFDAVRTHKNSVYRYLYIHDLREWDDDVDGAFLYDNDQNLYPHTDGIQNLRSGNLVERSWFDMPLTPNGISGSAFMIKQDVEAETIEGFTARENYLNGAGYTVHIHTLNDDLEDPGANGYPQDIVLEDNLIGRDHVSGVYSMQDVPSDNVTLTNNVWADDRTPVPDPAYVPYPLSITTNDSFTLESGGAGLDIDLESNNPSTWTIVGGTDQADFEIASTTLSIDDQTPGDYVVTVRATDAYAQTEDLTITVTFAASLVEYSPDLYFGPALVDWFDASDLSTITKDASNTVSVYTSKVGSGRNRTATLGNRPIYSATARNGLPGITFNGTNQWMTQTAVTGLPAGQAAVSYAIQAYGDASLSSGFKYYLSDANASGGTSAGRSLGTGTSGNTRVQGSTALISASLAGVDRGIVVSMAAGASQATTVNLDGGGTDTTGNVSVGSFTPTRRIMGAQAVGSNAVGSYSSFTHQEEITVNRALTADEIDQLQGYLAWKWDRESTLPSDHPYKDAPPMIEE